MSERHAAIVTISDSVHAGQRQDAGGDAVQAWLAAAGFAAARRMVVADERGDITAILRQLCEEQTACIVTTGGTGIGPRDVTPEATLDVIDRALPGMAEAMRAQTRQHTPFAMISRQVVGVRQRTLIINLPGNPKAVKECLDVIQPVLFHVIDLIHGRTQHGSE